jgi:hypothetical protein
MIASFNRLFDKTRPAFAQERTFERARTLAMSSLVGLGRRTVSGMLCASAQQFTDWSGFLNSRDLIRMLYLHRYGRKWLSVLAKMIRWW